MQPSARWLARWGRSRPGPEQERALGLALATLSTSGIWSTNPTGPSPEWEHAHTLARNQPLTHARLHARMVWPRLHGEGPREAARELERCAMAPIASLLRRIAGYRPDEPSGSSLLDTWKKRPRMAEPRAHEPSVDQPEGGRPGEAQPESPPKWANMGAK